MDSDTLGPMADAGTRSSGDAARRRVSGLGAIWIGILATACWILLVSPVGAQGKQGTHGRKSAQGINGGILVALGPNVKVTTHYVTAECIETNTFPGFTTSTWRELHEFIAETLTSRHACFAAASWVKWGVTIGAPYDDTGEIWFGQDRAGGAYYAKCDGFAKTSCLTYVPFSGEKFRSNRLELLPLGCSRDRHGTLVVHSGDTCAGWADYGASLPPELRPIFGDKLTTGFLTSTSAVKITNVGWDSCSIGSPGNPTDLRPDGVYDLSGTRIGLGHCFLLFQG